MKRYVIFGLLIFVGCIVAFMPAAVLVRLVDQSGPANLIGAAGTVWNGHAQVQIEGHSIGRLNWTFQPVSILRLQPGFDWSLSDPGLQMLGSVSFGVSGYRLSGAGHLPAALLQPWLDHYDIILPGSIEIPALNVQTKLPADGLPNIDGELRWSGGAIQYLLAGRLHLAQLPPMVAYFAPDDAGATRVTAFARGSDIPLMEAGPGAAGFIKVGLTKHFTKLLGNPWPGSDPDHKIVIEVEEQLF